MTTYELIQQTEKELEKHTTEFNDIHRKAKRIKQKKMQPLQRQLNELYHQWNEESKNKKDA